MDVYDLIIVGAGPAGLTAGIYSGRYLLKTLIIGELAGGMISEAHKVCNFPTYKEITGIELSQKMLEHAKENNAEVVSTRVEKIEKEKEIFKIETVDKKVYYAKKIILALGRKKRELNVPGEREFLGKGVSYCATCDAGFFKDKVVGVVGGSDAALTAALLLAEYAKRVYIIYRRDKFFRGEPAWIKLVEKNKKIEPVFNQEVKEIKGVNFVEGVVLKDNSELKLDGLFVEIGFIPDGTLAKQLGVKTDNGYIVVDKKQRTSINGVFAAGDITNNPLKQAITACGEGAIAADSAYEELSKERSLV